MEKYSQMHEDVNNNFDSLHEKFKASMDRFTANLCLYPSYANKIQTTFDNLIAAQHNLFDSTNDVITTIDDENILHHATTETLDKIQSSMDRLNAMNERIKLFYEVSNVLDDATIKMCEVSKKYQVYSELNLHHHPEKVNQIHNMASMFAEIEELKCLKGPILENTDENTVICVCYDGINHPEISPVWYKYDKSENQWVWSPFDPFSSEWTMFEHKWLSVATTAIDGEFGGEIFDGDGPSETNINIIDYLHDHNPVPVIKTEH